MQLDQLAPGVSGYTSEVGEALLVPVIIADKEGNGDVGRYLDTLPRDRWVIFPTVLSARLAGMLERRGFYPGQVDTGEEMIEAYLRPPRRPPEETL